MTPPVFLATLGQRPEAITIALDVLLPRYGYQQVGLLHTEPRFSGIADALEALIEVLRSDYPALKIVRHELCFLDGKPLFDIDTQRSAEAYYEAVYTVLKQYRAQIVPVHLMVAGGRKAMSIYATLAAALLFGVQDRVFTVLSIPEIIGPGQFHVPPGHLDGVQIVNLPLMPSRQIPGIVAGLELNTIYERRANPREEFLGELTIQQTRLVEALHVNPYITNETLSEELNKSVKTIENQLNAIYGKLAKHYDLDVEGSRKRQALIDVMAGRV